MSASDILLVEDEASSAEALAILLRMNGFEVRLAADGREALDRIAERRPDLVLSDIMMPGMSGLELLDTLRDDPQLADLPVVLMSSAYRALEAAGEKASALLEKPLDFRRLVPKLHSLLGDSDPDDPQSI